MTPEQGDLFAIPPSHALDPGTSHDAARSVALSATAHRQRILTYLLRCGDHGATAWELWKATGGSQPTGAGTRVGNAEMANDSWCRDRGFSGALTRETSEKRPTGTGRMAVVWVLTPAGRSEAVRLRSEAA